jgi:hypothetical protein
MTFISTFSSENLLSFFFFRGVNSIVICLFQACLHDMGVQPGNPAHRSRVVRVR